MYLALERMSMTFLRHERFFQWILEELTLGRGSYFVREIFQLLVYILKCFEWQTHLKH